jgi:hypothetical protein
MSRCYMRIRAKLRPLRHLLGGLSQWLTALSWARAAQIVKMWQRIHPVPARTRLDLALPRAYGSAAMLTPLGRSSGTWSRTVTWSTESMVSTLTMREQVRNAYSKNRDPICDDRMLWRAQSFRHIMHLLPRHTILELGCGDGVFTRQLINTDET